jgi:limonene-1,2-epoxide hydrolase
MSPREVVEEFVRRFNKRDATAIVELYHEDAVNHQVTLQPVEGRAAIREMFERNFATAEMTCIPEIIHEAGDVAILEWRDPLGLRGCGLFTIRNGRMPFSWATGTNCRFSGCAVSQSSERRRSLIPVCDSVLVSSIGSERPQAEVSGLRRDCGGQMTVEKRIGRLAHAL